MATIACDRREMSVGAASRGIMKTAIRTDASQEIGTGHVMRCLTLADELRARGADIRFVCRQLPRSFARLIRAHGHDVAMLAPARHAIVGSGGNEPRHAHWLGTGWEQDAQDMLACLADEEDWDWIVVDHYAIDIRWESALRKSLGSKIMVIDDLADRMHDCDVLLDQNHYRNGPTRYVGLVSPACRLLLGSGYVLLRREFIEARATLRQRDGIIHRILIFLGGADPKNMTGRVTDLLRKTISPQVRIDVVVGAVNPHLEDIEVLCAPYQNISLHIQAANMAELVAVADIAIGACGSATWERCYLGLPSLVLVMADNQRQAAQDLADMGVIVNLGDAENMTDRMLTDAVNRLMNDANACLELSRRSFEIMSENGNHAADWLV
ncbi:MAG: hypothetical protein JWQ21_3017 [Herminiimonas sp.]|nr:hypothetical protein [Herminiimonas sp.]